MPLLRRSTLPNAITVARILLAPVVFLLAFPPSFWSRFLAFLLFLAAAFSDLWDGYLARKHGWISDFGKLVDPLADKLLLVATLVPFYLISHRPPPVGGPLPPFDVLPFWILLVIFGREALVTGVRALAARRGLVIPAGREGKRKALSQNIFIGATLLWYALQVLAWRRGWDGEVWAAWRQFHGTVVGVSLVLALVLTIYSLGVYLWHWRRLARQLA